jgi:hypothetical protein
MAAEKKVLLAVLAHPDDETFGTGGTLAYYAARGVEVHLVCATVEKPGMWTLIVWKGSRISRSCGNTN